MAARVIQTFVERCAECPRSRYYSGGLYECALTNERMDAETRLSCVGARCPLPFSGPPSPPTPPRADKAEVRRQVYDLLTRFNSPESEDLVLDELVGDLVLSLR